MRILIDPGHGGKEEGAVGPTGLLEKEVNLKVAYKLKSLLENEGFEVFLTRTKDETLTLKERVNIAKKLTPCLFLSIHHNSNAERDARINRFEVFVPFEYTGPSLALGHKLVEIFTKERGQLSMGPLPARYTVLKSSPFSVLIEPGYIINPEEEKRLRDNTYIEKEAELIFKAITSTLKEGCNFRLKLKRQTRREIIVSRRGVKLQHIDVEFDGKRWDAFELAEEEIKVKYPASWKEMRITGTTINGIEIFPFLYRNPDYRPIVSFSQSVREFGNIKLIKLAFFDEIGDHTEKGMEVSISAVQGEIISHSKGVEDKGRIYILLKTDRPENNIKISLKGFEAITNVHSIEDLRANEIAGVVEDQKGGIENVVISSGESYTVSDKLGVFKIEVTEQVEFLKRGYFPYYMKEIEAGRNYNVQLSPIFPGLLRKKIAIRTSITNTGQDERTRFFSGFIKDFLSASGAYIHEIKTGFPGWDNEPATVRELLKTEKDVAIKLISRENKLVFYYYYRDEETLSILKRISSYFAKLDLSLPEIRESSTYFTIHPSGRRFTINLPFELDEHKASLYSYLIILGLEHYFSGNPVTLESKEAEGRFITLQDGLFKVPVTREMVYVPSNFLNFKLFTEEQRCIHSPDGN